MQHARLDEALNRHCVVVVTRLRTCCMPHAATTRHAKSRHLSAATRHLACSLNALKRKRCDPDDARSILRDTRRNPQDGEVCSGTRRRACRWPGSAVRPLRRRHAQECTARAPTGARLSSLASGLGWAPYSNLPASMSSARRRKASKVNSLPSAVSLSA